MSPNPNDEKSLDDNHKMKDKENEPKSPKSNKRRGSITTLFDNIQINSQTASRRKSKPLPAPPLEADPIKEEVEDRSSQNCKVVPPPQAFDFQNTEVKRICMSNDRSRMNFFAIPAQGWQKIEVKDDQSFREICYYNSITNKKIHGCSTDSKNILNCCYLCDADKWIFRGSEYDPSISLLYAAMDGCIPAKVLLTNPKFIIPWRYKNRKTLAISWKIIHMCGSQVTDAECETIVVNTFHDKKLRKIIEAVSVEAKWYEGAGLVEYLLKVVRLALGDYGLPGGATSSQADESLYRQMKAQGHNFMLLCSVKIGLCRHKALLFKILCDAVGLECALVTGYSTGGRHQWNLITLNDIKTRKSESYIIDPTSPHFTWTKQGSIRMKAYKIQQDTSFGHGGMTLKQNGIL
ncbi:hypothetical protein HDV06_001933 [Boothiomyces sp. JEL0866]|nr:hypothetical protein HDV06_001933 [Boothiomyces sp. JEL0866]